MEKVIYLPSGSLASRRSAIPFRDDAIDAFNKYQTIVFDLRDVDIISGSFADECIGILVRVYGFAEVKKKVRLINGQEHIYKSIAQVILDRKQEAENSKVFNQNQFAMI